MVPERHPIPSPLPQMASKRMNVSPLVSVIAPVYNLLPYLERALGCVLAQAHRDLEVVVIDDGPTDGFPTLCDLNSSQNVRVCAALITNGGLAAAIV